DLDGCLAEPVLKNRKIVRTEIPDHAGVRLMETEIHTAGRDGVDLAELLAVDEIADRVHRWAVEERVTRHEREPAIIGDRDKGFGLAHRPRHRLFDEYMLAGLEGRASECEVCPHRGGDHDRIDRRVLEHFVEPRRQPDRRKPPTDLGESRLVEVAYGC